MAMANDNGSFPYNRQEQLDKIWRTFTEQRTPQIREQLVLHYTWLVKHVLNRLSIVLPPSLDYGDLIGYGTVALIEAVDRYEPERGNKFETYASLKIRGAILDALRSMDFVSRPVRRRMKMITEAIGDLTRDLGRLPNDNEVANKLGMPVESLYHLYQRGAATLISLDAILVVEVSEDEVALHEAYADTNQLDPADEAVRSETAGMLAEVIEALPEREQMVLSLYYRDGLNMREIGNVLGISESRVCQIHSKAVTYMRAQLGQGDPDMTHDLEMASARELVNV